MQRIRSAREAFNATMRRLGRRGILLAGLGLIWVCTGIFTLLGEPSDTYALLAIAPELRGAAWIITGVVAIAYAHQPQGADALGFLSLYLMPAYRVVAYGAGFVAWLLDLGGTGRGLVGVLSWVTVILLILVVAGWPEPGPSTNEGEEKA